MRSRTLFVFALVVCFAGCAREETPVARLSAEPSRLELGYSEVRELHLSWHLLEPLESGGDAVAGEAAGAPEPRVFLHVIDTPGEVLRTYDHEFPAAWQPGEDVEYTVRIHQSALGPPLAAGHYTLTAGLYAADGRRWPLAVEGEKIDRREYGVAEIDVSPPSASPVFRFSDTWRPIESGIDRQVLGRRWLAGRGSIWITRAEEVRTVWMELMIPTPEPGLSRMILQEGAGEPALVVTSACGEVEIVLTGAGRHELEVPVGSATEDGPSECEIVFQPNYELVFSGSLERRTVLLEALAWSAGDHG